MLLVVLCIVKNYVCGHVDRDYPHSYDMQQKMKSRLFASITPVLELARQQQYESAAEVMTVVTSHIVNSQ